MPDTVTRIVSAVLPAVLADGPRGLPDLAQQLSLKIGAPIAASATVSRAVRVES